MEEEKRRQSDLKDAESLIERYGKILTLVALGAVGYLRLSWQVGQLWDRSENFQKNQDARHENRIRDEATDREDITALKVDVSWLKSLALKGK